MIDGLKIDVTGEELVQHLDERVQYHRERAEQCVRRAQRIESLGPDETTDADDDPEDDEGLASVWPGYSEELERRAERHRSRGEHFQFLRDRISLNEIYRLALADLRALEWLPAQLPAGSF